MTGEFGNLNRRDGAQTLDVLEELEFNRPEDLRQARENGLIRVKAGVIVRPASLSQRADSQVSGTTAEVQRHSVSCRLERPTMVGDVFQLEFDRTTLDVVPVYAMCDRCTFLDETAFEVRFRLLEAMPAPG